MEEAQSRLLELIEAALRGEAVVIPKDDQEAVQWMPARRLVRRQFGSAKGQVFMAGDFDAPLTDFKE